MNTDGGRPSKGLGTQASPEAPRRLDGWLGTCNVETDVSYGHTNEEHRAATLPITIVMSTLTKLLWSPALEPCYWLSFSARARRDPQNPTLSWGSRIRRSSAVAMHDDTPRYSTTTSIRHHSRTTTESRTQNAARDHSPIGPAPQS